MPCHVAACAQFNAPHLQQLLTSAFTKAAVVRAVGGGGAAPAAGAEAGAVPGTGGVPVFNVAAKVVAQGVAKMNQQPPR